MGCNAMHARFGSSMVSHVNHLGENEMKRCDKGKMVMTRGMGNIKENSVGSFALTEKGLPPSHHKKVHIRMDTSILYTLPHINEKDFNLRF